MKRLASRLLNRVVYLLPLLLPMLLLGWFVALHLGFIVASSPENGVIVAVEWDSETVFYWDSLGANDARP